MLLTMWAVEKNYKNQTLSTVNKEFVDLPALNQ